MIGRFLPIFCALLLMLASMLLAVEIAAQIQENGPPSLADTNSATSSLVLLRSGEYLVGHVTQDKDRYIVESDGVEVRLSARDVDFICRSLDEAYTKQRDRIAAGSTEDRLRLVNWCLRHRLLGYAATELAAAMEVNPRHPGIAVLDRRLQQATELANESKKQVRQNPDPTGTANSAPERRSVYSNKPIDSPPVALPDAQSTSSIERPPAETRPTKPRAHISSAELDRWSRNLPAGTVEHFIETVQPILMNSCSTAGCHGAASKSQYSLIRPAANGRITPRGTSQRNLFNTLEWVDHKQPHESEFLKYAREPHGGKPVAVLAESSIQFQQLVAWVLIATDAKATSRTSAPATVELTPPGTHAQIGSPFQPSPPAPYVNQPSSNEARKPIEKPTDEKPFYEQRAPSEMPPAPSSPMSN